MLAIGILAVGLAMSMSIFPAAVKQNEASFDDVLGSIIAENGLTVAEVALQGSSYTSMGDRTTTVEGFRANSTCYPLLETSGTPSASNVTGRFRALASEDTIVILAYRGHTLGSLSTLLTGTAASDEAKWTSSSGITPGGFLVNASSGNHARVLSKNSDTEYVLDRTLTDTSDKWYYAEDAIAARSAKVSLE